MSNDRPRHALFRAPAELRANGRMPDESVATSADERALDRCAVANVDLDIFYRCGAIVNKKQIRTVENTGAACTDPVPDGWSQDRMCNGEGLQGNAAIPSRHS